MSIPPLRGFRLITRLTALVRPHLLSCRRQWLDYCAARRLRAAEAEPIPLPCTIEVLEPRMLLSTLLDGNLQIVDLSDLNAPLPLTVDSTTQVLTRTQDWEHSSWMNPSWPTGGLSIFGYPTVVKNTHGLNQDGKYYLYYAHHDPMSGIGCAVADSITGTYYKIPGTDSLGNPDSKVLTVPNYNPAGPNTGDPSHYSSPSVVWNENESKWFMYFHYDNHYHSAWESDPNYGGGRATR